MVNIEPTTLQEDTTMDINQLSIILQQTNSILMDIVDVLKDNTAALQELTRKTKDHSLKAKQTKPIPYDRPAYNERVDYTRPSPIAPTM